MLVFVCIHMDKNIVLLKYMFIHILFLNEDNERCGSSSSDVVFFVVSGIYLNFYYNNVRVVKQI